MDNDWAQAYQTMDIPTKYRSAFLPNLIKRNRYNCYCVGSKNEWNISILIFARNLQSYNATLAHLVNHNRKPNADFLMFDHPRFGKIRWNFLSSLLFINDIITIKVQEIGQNVIQLKTHSSFRFVLWQISQHCQHFQIFYYKIIALKQNEQQKRSLCLSQENLMALWSKLNLFYFRSLVLLHDVPANEELFCDYGYLVSISATFLLKKYQKARQFYN